MARPKKITTELRTEFQNVRLNEEEKAKILKKAKAMGMSVSRYLRETGLSSDDTRLPKIRHQLIYEIRKIGVNHNQIAHYLNIVMAGGGAMDNKELLEEFKKIFNLLSNALTELKSNK